MHNVISNGQFDSPLPVLYQVGLIYVLLGVTALPYTDFIPRLASYALALPVYAIFVLLWVTQDENSVRIPRFVLWSLSIIWGIYLLNMGFAIFDGSLDIPILIRVPTFIVFTGLNILIIPYLVSRRVFLTALSGFATVLVAIAIPTLILPQYGIGPIQIKQWGPTFELLPGTGIMVHPIKSIFRNPNTLSFIIAVGLVSAVSEYIQQRSRQSKVKVFVLASGLYMAHGRSAIGAAIIGIAILILATKCSPTRFRQLVVLGISGGIFAFAILIGLISVPIPVPTLNLQGRIELWEGSIRAVMQRPLLGYGPGDTGELIAPFVDQLAGYNPHNSYLRMYVTTGVVGGTTYLFLLSKVVYDQLRSTITTDRVTLFTVCIVVTAIQVFAAYSIFGLSLNSVVTALAYGYGIQSLFIERNPSNMNT